MAKNKLPPVYNTLITNILRSIDRYLKNIPIEWRMFAINIIQDRLDEWKKRP